MLIQQNKHARLFQSGAQPNDKKVPHFFFGGGGIATSLWISDHKWLQCSFLSLCHLSHTLNFDINIDDY